MAVQYVEASKMDTNFRKLNCMLSLWYGVIAGSLQIYLIVQNVWKFVRFAELPWPNQQTPTLELNIFIGLNGFAVLLLPFFITACFLKIGNLANDNEMLGKKLKCSGTVSGGLKSCSNEGSSSNNPLLAIWTHFGPISSLLHVICSVCLLFPQTLVDGVLIKNGFLPKEGVWKSDLDFLNQNEVEDMVIRPIGGDNGLSDFVKRVSPLTAKQGGLRLEFINYAMALFIFSIRYAQVFWSCHKKFAIILGLQQIINSAHTLISFSTLIVLYKVHVASVYAKSTPFLLDSQMTLLIFGIALTVLFLSSSVLYYLGYLKYMAFLQEKIYDKSLNYSGGESSFYGGGWTYFPHSAAVSIALALAAAQSPLVHDGFVVYQMSSQRFLLAFPISSVAYFLLWAVLWLFLTLAKNWKFNITATIIQPIHDLENTGLPTEITIDLKESSVMGPFSPSLVVISEGKAFSVENAHDQKSILALIPKKSSDSTSCGEPTYWKTKTTTPTPTPSCLSYKQKDHSKIKYMPCRKEVTFDDELVSPRYYSRPPSRADNNNKTASGNCGGGHLEDFDSGEYAYLAGSRNSHSQSLKSPVRRPSSGQARESLYGQLPGKINFMERNQVVSPVSTVDSSSGVSSISTQSQLGPPSTSASCSQFSDGVGSDHHHDSPHQQQMIAEPRAHYEPLRMLSRRNSVRSYISSHQSPANAEAAAEYYQRTLMDEVYGKLKTGRQVSRSESIYSVGNRQPQPSTTPIMNNNMMSGEVRLNNRSIYEHYSTDLESSPRCNYTSNNNSKFQQCDNGNGNNNNTNCNNSFTNNNNSSKLEPTNCKKYDLDDDCTNPPIPPPLPILSCVVRKSLSNSDEIQVI